MYVRQFFSMFFTYSTYGGPLWRDLTSPLWGDLTRRVAGWGPLWRDFKRYGVYGDLVDVRKTATTDDTMDVATADEGGDVFGDVAEVAWGDGEACAAADSYAGGRAIVTAALEAGEGDEDAEFAVG